MNTEKAQDQRAPFAAGLLLMALVTWILVGTAARDLQASPVRGGDFKFFYEAAQRLNAHQPLYAPDPNGATYVYAPLLAIALRPFVGPDPITPTGNGQEEFWHAQHVWFYASAGCLVAAVILFALAMRLTLLHSAAIGVMLITAFHCWPATMTFALGQTNMVVVAALAGMFYADSRNRLVWVGLFIVAGALVKTWFAGMLLYLLVRRAWKPMAVCCAAAIAALLVLFAIVGFSQVRPFLDMTFGYASSQMGSQVLSQSIAGFARLHFGPPLHIHPLIESPQLTAAVKWTGTMIVLAGLGLLFAAKTPITLVDHRLRLAIVSVSLLLLLPYCQNEYIVMALPAIWTLMLMPQPKWCPFLISAVSCFLLIMWGGPYYPNEALAYQDGMRSLRVSVPFFTLVILWISLLTAYLRSRASAGPAAAIADSNTSNAVADRVVVHA